MTAYYNDNDPFVCRWLRNLIAAGVIAPGDVDDRDIREIEPHDLEGYDRVHLFAGIGGWDLALQLAGWPIDRPVWTASCPCPPFSQAGKSQSCPACESRNLVWCPRRTGFAICADCQHAWLADERHLWPEVWRLAALARPGRVFGEQVASPAGLDWLASVRASLEILGYTVGASDLPAAGVGAPHIRQRLWWVADADQGQCGWVTGSKERQHDGATPGWKQGHGQPECGRSDGGLADPERYGRRQGTEKVCRRESIATKRGEVRGLALSDGGDASAEGLQRGGEYGQRPGDGQAGRVGVAHGKRRQQGDQGSEITRSGHSFIPTGGSPDGLGDAESIGRSKTQRGEANWVGPGASGETHWSRAVAVPCTDGKTRFIEPSIFPVVDGLPESVDGGGPIARIGTIRGAGNAISPQVAAEFVAAFMECEPGA